MQHERMQHDQPLAYAESRGLTGLRGVAAGLVIAHHLYLKVGLDQKLPMLQFLLRKGYLGVDLFFVLSGFVMAMTYGTWFDGSRPHATPATTARHVLAFLVRRIARVWPLHVILVALLVLFGLQPPGTGVSPRLFIANLAMVQAWGISAEINPPAWSVSTEFLAYLLFPLLAAIALRGRTGPALCLLGSIALLLACLHFAPPIGAMRRGRLDIYYNYSTLPALRCIAGFTLGMLAWRLGRLPAIARLAGYGWLGPLLLLALFALMLGRVNDLIIYPLLPALVLAIHYGRGPGLRLLGAGPIHRLGVLSYAIYLVHYTLITQLAASPYPTRAVLPAFLLLTLAIATAAHYAIERPFRTLLRTAGDAALARLTPRLTPPACPPPA